MKLIVIEKRIERIKFQNTFVVQDALMQEKNSSCCKVVLLIRVTKHWKKKLKICNRKNCTSRYHCHIVSILIGRRRKKQKNYHRHEIYIFQVVIVFTVTLHSYFHTVIKDVQSNFYNPIFSVPGHDKLFLFQSAFK